MDVINSNGNEAEPIIGQSDKVNDNFVIEQSQADNNNLVTEESASQEEGHLEDEQRQNQGSVAYNSYKCLKAVDLENLANNNTILETVLEEETEETAAAAAAIAGKVEKQLDSNSLQQQQLERQLIEQVTEQQKLETESVSSQGSHASGAKLSNQAANGSCQQSDTSCQIVSNSCQTKSVSSSISSSQQTTFTKTTSHQTTITHNSCQQTSVSDSSQTTASDSSQQLQSCQGSSSSSRHRVKFTEELPTASSYKRMTTSASTLATAMTPELVVSSSDAAQQDQEGHPPHITISEDLPTKDPNNIDSSYEGWDNPFRPEGEISHEADELLRLWKEGKLNLQNGTAGTEGTDQNSTSDPETSLDASGDPANGTDPVKTPLLSSDLNGGHKNGGTSSTFVPSTTTVKREPSQQLTAKPVNIDSSPKKKKTNGCCSVM